MLLTSDHHHSGLETNNTARTKQHHIAEPAHWSLQPSWLFIEMVPGALLGSPQKCIQIGAPPILFFESPQFLIVTPKLWPADLTYLGSYPVIDEETKSYSKKPNQEGHSVPWDMEPEHGLSGQTQRKHQSCPFRCGVDRYRVPSAISEFCISHQHQRKLKTSRVKGRAGFWPESRRKDTPALAKKAEGNDKIQVYCVFELGSDSWSFQQMRSQMLKYFRWHLKKIFGMWFSRKSQCGVLRWKRKTIFRYRLVLLYFEFLSWYPNFRTSSSRMFGSCSFQ